MNDLSRRSALTLLGATGLAPYFLTAHAAGAGDRKTIFIILRGAMDGLAALIPDDRELKQLRSHTLPEQSGRLNLKNGFRLHPALASVHGLYRRGEVGFVHAAATSHRDRSHFDAQDVLETMGRGTEGEGWLNRVVQAAGGTGLMIGHDVPLALQGTGPATNWSPPVFDVASDDLLDRLQDLYAGQPQLADSLAMARSNHSETLNIESRRTGPEDQYAVASRMLGQLMSADDGPNIGMLSFAGWDTHANQAGRFAVRLAALDKAIIDLKDTLGASWAKTAVIICSEFGRTALENGTQGTDHGTGGLVILAGGNIRGGRIHGDWPGLKDRDLYENRDLAPANDVSSILKGVLRDHLPISRSTLDTRIFDARSAPMNGLVRS